MVNFFFCAVEVLIFAKNSNLVALDALMTAPEISSNDWTVYGTIWTN